jgi:hypothetical protein
MVIVGAQHYRCMPKTGVPFELTADAVIFITGEPVVKDEKIGLKNFGDLDQVVTIRSDQYLEFLIR